jgi:hypothetical protein
MLEEKIIAFISEPSKRNEDALIHAVGADVLLRDTEDLVRKNLKAIAEEVGKELSPGYWMHKRYFPSKLFESTDPALSLFYTKIKKDLFRWNGGLFSAPLTESKTKVKKEDFKFKEVNETKSMKFEAWWNFARHIWIDRNHKKVLASKCGLLPVGCVVHEDSLKRIADKGWTVHFVGDDKARYQKYLREAAEMPDTSFLIAQESDGKWTLFETENGEEVYFVRWTEDRRILVEDENGKQVFLSTFGDLITFVREKKLSLVGVIFDEDKEEETDGND